jgi:hypothetical protein
MSKLTHKPLAYTYCGSCFSTKVITILQQHDAIFFSEKMQKNLRFFSLQRRGLYYQAKG